MSAIESTNATAAVLPRSYGRRWSLAATAVLFFVVVFSSPVLMPGWASMLANVAAIFYSLKHCVWLMSSDVTRGATMRERLEFYLLSPAFDLPAFLDRTAPPPSWAEWCIATCETALGAFLLWVVIPYVALVAPPWVVGIVGMASGAMFLLFGVFHIAALLWQRAGRAVQPIMNYPWAADSLADFWGRRWNMSFRDSAAVLVFRPLARRWRANMATFGTFVFSGLLHEPLISMPAHSGYGLPTVYFLLQFAGLMFQRRFLPCEVGKWNLLSRLSTVVVVLVPLPLLFHKPFCEHVVIPFLHVLGAL